MQEGVPLLRDLLVLLLVAVPVAFFSRWIRLPTIVAFMLVGVLVGPHGLALVREVEAVQVLAEIGVALLLFVIGLEFSLRRLLQMRRLLLLGGGLQVLLTGLTTTGVVLLFGRRWQEAIFVGFLVALSSTALVLRSYQDRAELDAPQGRVALAILLFQDLCIIPMMILVPVLGGTGGTSLAGVGLALGKAALAVVAIVAAARLVVPLALGYIVRMRSSEIFLLSAALVVFGTAWLTSRLGLSVPVGAFLAGLVLSESEFSHQIVADFLPFRDVFNSLFFISIGMLLSASRLVEHWQLVLGLVLLLMAGKTLLTGGVIRFLGFPVRVALLAGIGLAQIGEFSFVLAREGIEVGLLGATEYQVFLAAAILSMVATPLMIAAAPRLAYATGPGRLDRVTGPEGVESLTGHVVVVGFGLNGRNLARVLRETGIAHLVVELSADLASDALRQGESILYGDATRREVLVAAGIERARIMVLAISDPMATRHTVVLGRQLNPRLRILVRTRYVRELEDLLRLGADWVIPEEFETSIQIFNRVLEEYQVPREKLEEQVEAIRREGYQMLRRGRRFDPPDRNPEEPPHPRSE